LGAGGDFALEISVGAKPDLIGARRIDFTSPKPSRVASADEDHRPYRILKPPVSVGPQALGPQE